MPDTLGALLPRGRARAGLRSRSRPSCSSGSCGGSWRRGTPARRSPKPWRAPGAGARGDVRRRLGDGRRGRAADAAAAGPRRHGVRPGRLGRRAGVLGWDELRRSGRGGLGDRLAHDRAPAAADALGDAELDEELRGRALAMEEALGPARAARSRIPTARSMRASCGRRPRPATRRRASSATRRRAGPLAWPRVGLSSRDGWLGFRLKVSPRCGARARRRSCAPSRRSPAAPATARRTPSRDRAARPGSGRSARRSSAPRSPARHAPRSRSRRGEHAPRAPAGAARASEQARARSGASTRRISRERRSRSATLVEHMTAEDKVEAIVREVERLHVHRAHREPRVEVDREVVVDPARARCAA